uniref:Novel peptide 1 n=1 Tax=Pithecopus azureus TaxID=2034991 RepID=NOVP1_PITAZ|nr:RecName: Full=Novel peptide 1; AltName: Full=PRP-HA1 [Pithecopus azureus]
FLFFAFPHPL